MGWIQLQRIAWTLHAALDLSSITRWSASKPTRRTRHVHLPETNCKELLSIALSWMLATSCLLSTKLRSSKRHHQGLTLTVNGIHDVRLPWSCEPCKPANVGHRLPSHICRYKHGCNDRRCTRDVLPAQTCGCQRLMPDQGKSSLLATR